MFVSITSAHASGSASQNGCGSVMNRGLTNRIPRAALLTSTSIRPLISSARATSRSTSPATVTSACTAWMLPGSDDASSATASASSAFRAALITTSAPACAYASAIDRPSPRPPPVTIATRWRRSEPTQLQSTQCPVSHEHAGSSTSICSGFQRRSQSSATGSVRSAGPPGQQAPISAT